MAQTEFTLDPSQSMLMTGKGLGQDGTINPYDGQDCYAIIENIGDVTFYVRIQKEGKVLQTVTVAKNETQKLLLLKDQELYLDPNEIAIARARVSYDRVKESY